MVIHHLYLFFLIFFFVAVSGIYSSTLIDINKERVDIKNLKSGDIILLGKKEINDSGILGATNSYYYHSGIIEIENGTAYVIEAAPQLTVRRIDLKSFVDSVHVERLEIKRFAYDDVAQRSVEIAKSKIGQRFDETFCGIKPRHQYCSGLVASSFNEAYKEINETSMDIFPYKEIDYNKKFWQDRITPEEASSHKSISPSDLDLHRGLSTIEICLRKKISQYNYSSSALDW